MTSGIAFSVAGGWFVLHLLLKATLVLCIAGAVALTLARASAAVRHLVWTVSVAGLISLPFLSLILPKWELPVKLGVEWSAAEAWPGSAFAPSEASPTAQTQPAPAEAAVETPGSWTPADVRAARSSEPIRWSTWLFGAWALGATALLLRLPLGWWGIRRMARDAEVVVDPAWTQMLRDAAWTLDVAREVKLLRSSRTTMPMTWGTLRPAVQLPAEADQWPPERRRVVLLHELAHVARRDCLTQTLADLACALYWFHPLTWIAARRLRAERERACDDRVIAVGERASEYATHLLQVARAYRPARPVGVAGIAMARPSQLEGRLLAVLDSARSRSVPGPRARIAGVCAGALVLLPLAAARAVAAHAEDTAAPSWHEAPASEERDAEALTLTSSQDRVVTREVPIRPGEAVRLELETGGEVRLIGWDRDVVSVRAELRGPEAKSTWVELSRRAPGVWLTSEHLDAGNAATASHRFEMRVPSRTDVRIQSRGGNVSIEGIRGMITGGIGSGELKIYGAVGETNLRTDSGAIMLSGSRPDGKVNTASGGDARVLDTPLGPQERNGNGSSHVRNTGGAPSRPSGGAETRETPRPRPQARAQSGHARTVPVEPLDDHIDRIVEQAVESGLRAAGEAISEADIGRLVAEITIRATREALAGTAGALAKEEREVIEREVREEIRAEIQNHSNDSVKPQRQ